MSFPFRHRGWRSTLILPVQFQSFGSLLATKSSALLNVCNGNIAERTLEGDLGMFHVGLVNVQHGLALVWCLGFFTGNDSSDTTITAVRTSFLWLCWRSAAVRRYWNASLNVIRSTWSCNCTCTHTFSDWLHGGSEGRLSLCFLLFLFFVVDGSADVMNLLVCEYICWVKVMIDTSAGRWTPEAYPFSIRRD